jgi:RNA polymerase sigma factor (sigma-70 family)
MQDDLELLWEYARSGSNDAFATVASRYIDLIYSAALRQVNGDTHVAQDVTQAVLIILMNKAAKLPAGTVLAGWLLKVTRFAALDAMKLQRRRNKYERQAAEMRSEAASQAESAADEPRWQSIAPHIDTALLTLRSLDRDAITLRYLLGKTPEEIAWVMGVSEEAARQRVSRALGRLRAALARRGIVTAESALGNVIAANAVMRAPAVLSSLAGTIALPGSGALSTPPAVIAKGTVRMMTWGSAKWVVVSMFLLICVAVTVIFWMSPKHDQPAGVTTIDAQPLKLPATPAPRKPTRSFAQIDAQYANKIKSNSRLGWATFGGDLEAVQAFVGAGDDVNYRSRDGQEHTPLHWAAWKGRDTGYELIRYLLDHGADVNAQRSGGTTALMMSIRRHSPRTVRLLLERGADVRLKTAKGETALDWAKQENDPEILKMIEQAAAAQGLTTSSPSTAPAR